MSATIRRVLVIEDDPETARQVADCRVALCHGLGGMFSAAATLVASTEV